MTKKEFLSRLISPLPNAVLEKYPNGHIRQFWGENANLYSEFFNQKDALHHFVAGHNGIDIATHFRDTIHAMHDGTIAAIQTERDAVGGLEVLVMSDELDDEGVQMKIGTFYCHLDEIRGKVGDRVKQGDIVGYEGNTGFIISEGTPFWGNAPAGKGVHLHLSMFEYVGPGINKRIANALGGSTDPLPYISQSPSRYSGFKIVLENIVRFLNYLKGRGQFGSIIEFKNKLMDKKSFLWGLLKSSQDPNKVSLFLKGLVGTATLLGLLKVEIGAADVDSAALLIVTIVTAAGSVVTGVVSLWGLVRKFL